MNNNYNGLINIYKEPGFTSNDVVAKLRGILKMRKIGHTGTLDPDAVGVLVCCLGSGTSLVEELTDHTKEYIAVCRLGLTTDTQDMSGNILSKWEGAIPSAEEVMAAAAAFVGPYEQMPPMYSALKVGGRKLYELAREGVEVERKARLVNIDSITILDMSKLESDHEFTMEVRCSKGTYIRTLCNDIGERLGCGAAMAHLTRTAVGSFHLDTAIPLSRVEELRDAGELDTAILPIEDFFRDLDVVHIREGARKGLLNGNPFKIRDIADEEPLNAGDHTDKADMYEDGSRVRVYDDLGDFVGIYRYNSKTGNFRVDKFLYNSK
ncbi:tRNA pseudouridine(55) synthase TruB [Butyrivibrio sp. MC2013]|uniref:tRNA pseudouridine(55) synthase TruB n=1 Tax=Butyrivibrio sp. MC2013 TaxID=1280686 RepID=UPI00041A812E|nr:tRNA pseudouridine(55) synthase TruB [Butyrivibrio sp. MC2013]